MRALERFPRITPFLWFDANAEAAVDFYARRRCESQQEIDE
jgi:predicted 3-demethylubiquinone-9 3-methyltransferase (glyoxalase superfamily)